jgi:outer membrane lipoprotein-sorting protein
MKNLKLLLILPVLVVIVSGCTAGNDQRAVDILQSSIEKSSTLSSYTSSYSMDLDMSVNAGQGPMSLMSMQGTVDMWKRDDSAKILGDFDLGFFDQITEMSLLLYLLPSGVYMCAEGECSQAAETGLPINIETSEQTLDMMQNLLAQGAVTVSYIGTKTIIGQTCDDIKILFDPNKIAEALSLPQTTVGELGDMNINMYYTLCIEPEYGQMLETKMVLTGQTVIEQTSATIAFEMDMIATALDVNANIPDSEFELPYPVS